MHLLTVDHSADHFSPFICSIIVHFAFFQAASQLDELHQQRLLELDNVDLLDFSPVLIKKQGGSCGVP